MTELWLLRLCHGPIWVLGCQFEGVSSCLSLGRGEGAVQGARHGAWPPGEAWLAATSHHQPRPRPGVHPHIIHGHHLLVLLVFPSFPHSLSPLGPRMQFWIVTLSSALPVSDSLWSAVTNHQPAFFLPPWWIRGRWPPLRHLFPHAAANPFLVGPCARYASGQLAISARVSGLAGLDNGLYEIYAGADTSSRGECSHGCFNGETQLGEGRKKAGEREGAAPAPGWRERVELSVSYCAKLGPAALYFTDPISGWGSPPR